MGDQQRTDAGQGAEGSGNDDVRARMREALDRKHAGEHAGQPHLDGRQAARGEHGREGGPREFRRKAGG
jgi:hypothetical protein